MEEQREAGAQREYPVLDSVFLEFKNLLRKLEPGPEVTGHFRRARIETLKGIRQAIDNTIERLERTGSKGEKINVD